MNVLDSHEEKVDENQANPGHVILVEPERLAIENKDQKKLLQICDEKEHEYKEEIVSMRTQLEEARRVEDVINNLLKEREKQREILEAKIVSARSELDEKNKQYERLEEKSSSSKATIEEDATTSKILVGEASNNSSSNETTKEDATTSKRPVREASSNIITNKGKHKNHQQKIELKKMQSTPMDEVKKPARIQRRNNVTCFHCHKIGHITTNCKSK